MSVANDHSAEVLRCLIELDVAGMRRIHAHVWPHYPQPMTDDDALIAMHAARLKVRAIPQRLKEYSEQWLLERHGPTRCGVGVAVGIMRDAERALNQREAMVDSVNDSVKAGIDIDKEAPEVKRRMLIARDKA